MSTIGSRIRMLVTLALAALSARCFLWGDGRLVPNEGRYDIWLTNADGTNPRCVVPGYVPAGFLCHSPLFDATGDTIYFIGQWWQ